MMKLWLVSRTDEVSYDEYDSFVIRAETLEEAVQIAQTEECHGHWSGEELTRKGKLGIILGSYNAG